MRPDYDVIVVGAGPGGATAARCCAEGGLKTLLVEKEKLPRYKPCGGCLSPKAVKLVPFDLSPVVENVIFGVRFTYRLKNPISIKTENPIGYMVMRDRFDQFLTEKGLEKGVDLIEANKVIRVEEGRGGIEIRLAKGERFHCRHLIGADGPNSVVARSFSLKAPRDSGGGMAIESEIPFEVTEDFPKTELSFIHLDFGGVPNGYGWVFPKRKCLSIGIGGMFEAGETMNPRRYYDLFAGRLPYLKVKTKEVMGHPLPAFYDGAQKASRGRVLLVGDAAHLMDPLMGEGIYYAIRSGVLAAEAIIESKDGSISPSEIYEASLQHHLFSNLKGALYFSRFVFRFTRLAYFTFKRYPELGHFYVQVLEGTETYPGFVAKVKARMKDLPGGRLSEKIKKAMVQSV